MLQIKEEKMKQGFSTQGMPDICGLQLATYAESLRELAKSFEKDKPAEQIGRQALFEEERQKENCDVIAGHLTELAQIMEQTAEEMASLEPLEEKIWKKMSRGLREQGIHLEGACVLPQNRQGRRLSLNLRAEPAAGVSIEKAEEVLQRVLGKKYCVSLSSPERIHRERELFLFVEQPRYMAFTGFARVIKGREEISGDNYSMIQSECGKLTMLLSDGTGSGQQACEGSGWVLDLMERLLEAGYGMDTAARLVNAAILTKGDEMGHPTLDLCQVDLQKGYCGFCKVGGAVSFCKRGEEVEQIDGGRLPLGIFPDLEPHRSFLRLGEGESLFMMTDGVLEAFREKGYEEAVRNAIAGMEESSPREMAEKLMQLAIFASEGNVRDDMTILTATLWKAP